MTVCPKFIARCQAWVDKHQDSPCECTEENGRAELIEDYRRLVDNVSHKIASGRVGYHIKRLRGIIAPEFTNKGLPKKEKGEATSSSPEEQRVSNHIKNPINNAINNAKVKKERRDRAIKYHLEHGESSPLSDEQVEEEVCRIISDVDIGGLGTLKRLQSDPSYSFYVGETKRSLKEEGLRWLTARGKLGGGSNRPVLVHSDHTVESPNLLTMKTAEEDFGFKSQILYETTLLINASAMEDKLQDYFLYLPLGTRRLWRCVAKGQSSDKDDVEEKEIYKVFITYSTQVAEKLEEGTLMIQPGEPPNNKKRRREWEESQGLL